MLGVIDKLAAAREWKRDHIKAWEGAGVPGVDGLSAFQHECRAALTASCGDDLVFEERGVDERFLYAERPKDGLRIFIYLNGVELRVGEEEQRLEEWDTASPTAMVEKAASFLAQRMGVT